MKAHVCFEAELVYDSDSSKWRCRDCLREYEPPKHEREKIPEQKYWNPWSIPLRKIVIWRFAEVWRPWRSYLK
jgi:hypothetical protein